MKYDTDDAPEEIAEDRRVEGNKYYKLGKWRWAIECYTQGALAPLPNQIFL